MEYLPSFICLINRGSCTSRLQQYKSRRARGRTDRAPGILPKSRKGGNLNEVLHKQTHMVCLSRRRRTESPARSARHDFGAQIQSKRASRRGCLFRRLRTAIPRRVSEKKRSPRRSGVEGDHDKHELSVFSTRKEHGVGMSAIRRKQRVLERLCRQRSYPSLFFRMLSLCRRQDRISAHARKHIRIPKSLFFII